MSWSRKTHEELCFVWGGGRGGHGRMVCWVLPRHRLNGKEEIYSGRPPSTPRIESLRRTRFCRQNEQRCSHSLVAEDRKTASFDANRIKWRVLACNSTVALTVFRLYIVPRCGDTVEIQEFPTVPDGILGIYRRARVERTVHRRCNPTTCRDCGAPLGGGTAGTCTGTTRFGTFGASWQPPSQQYR